MSKFYLGSCGVNNSQEKVLKAVSETLFGYLGDYSEPVISFVHNGVLIMNPFVSSKGKPVNPVEEYGQAFLESDFMKIAKAVQIEADAPHEKVKEEVEKVLISKLGLNSNSDLERWLDSHELDIKY